MTGSAEKGGNEQSHLLDTGAPTALYGHVVRFPMEDPAHRILNANDPVEWNRLRGRPSSSCLARLGDHMKEWSMGPMVARNSLREWSRVPSRHMLPYRT